MNKFISYNYTQCVNCGTKEIVPVQCDQETSGEIFKFDLCIPCEEMVRMRMSPSEKLDTFYREVGLRG